MPTYRMNLAYDGTDFHGYARQDNVRTVQGDLETALFRRTGEIKTVVAGRTDRGVHASDQVVSFAVDEPFDVMLYSAGLRYFAERLYRYGFTVPIELQRYSYWYALKDKTF